MGRLDSRNLLTGILFIFTGLFFFTYSTLTLSRGTLLFMGPGFFPTMLGLILAAFGIAIFLSALRSKPEAIGAIPWKGVALVTLAVLIFGITVRGLGFGPSTFIATFLASSSTDRNKLVQALMISAVMTVFSIGVFIYALGLPYDVIGRWVMSPG